MPAQSGIEPSGDVLDKWQQQLADPQLRLVKWSIDGEQVTLAGTWPSLSPTDSDPSDQLLQRDFALFDHQDVVQDKVPAYFAFRLTPPPASTFAFIAWVPDHAAVRPKMLYASSTNTLVRALGDSRFPVRISAAEKNDLTYDSYLSTITHDSADAPLTAREAEMAEIRAAEASTVHDAEAASGRSMLFGPIEGSHASARDPSSETVPPADGSRREITGALPWTDQVADKVRELGSDAAPIGACAVLEIDVPNETVVLASDQPQTLAVPSASPCYLLYRHPAGLVLVYSCPPSSPVKSRLLYSSAVLIFCKRAVPEWTGLSILKKLETSDPTEITPEWIDAELGPLAAPPAQADQDAEAGSVSASASASGTSTPKPESEVKFARPTRPGRRR
ncbi:hypothetical protein JCM3774_000120 [Rhodotorula dairenensis]